jgi:serine-type D-Ala-D-Ala carboxypeptidase (penicillin-binding protein 5/6)
MPTTLKSIVTALGSLVLVAGAFGAGVFAVNLPVSGSQVAAATLSIQLDPHALTAVAAIVLDLKTGTILYQKDAQEPLPLASLTKLMTLQSALSDKDLSTSVRITAADLAPEGDWGLHVGDTLSLQDLVSLAIVASCNDCAEAVASTLGTNSVSALNDTAQEMDLTRSSFSNPTGLDIDVENGDAGAYGSAFDVARLMGAFYKAHPELLYLTTKPSISVPDGDRMLTYPATMAPIQNVPGFIGAKTGYTDLAGGNLAAVFDLGFSHPVAVVVLHSTEEGRFDDVRTLISALRATQ